MPLPDHVTTACPRIRQADIWIITAKRFAQSIQDRKRGGNETTKKRFPVEWGSIETVREGDEPSRWNYKVIGTRRV